MKPAKQPKTKAAAFAARADALITYTVKGDARGERIRFAIREGLLVPSIGRNKERGGALRSAMHCMGLVEINAAEGGRTIDRDPETILVYLAAAAEEIERIVDAVTIELDAAEAEVSARKARTAKGIAA